jgi:uncharacterized membrane protein
MKKNIIILLVILLVALVVVVSWNKKMQNKVNANKAAEKQKWRNVYGNKNEPQYVN